MVKVIDLLGKWRVAKQSKIDDIQKQMSECKNCDTKGNLKNETPSFMGFSFPKMCDCTEVDKKPEAYFKSDLGKIDKGYNFIHIEVPSEYKKNLIISNDEIDFINSDKKVLWIYNREKGAGKTTRAYSIAAISRVLINFNVKFTNESKIPFNTFAQEYQYNIDHQELILLDDIGVEPDKKGLLTDFYYRFFNDIRNTNCKVIFTSQFSIKEWLGRLKSIDIEQGERVEDRFRGIALEKQIGIKE